MVRSELPTDAVPDRGGAPRIIRLIQKWLVEDRPELCLPPMTDAGGVIRPMWPTGSLTGAPLLATNWGALFQGRRE